MGHSLALLPVRSYWAPSYALAARLVDKASYRPPRESNHLLGAGRPRGSSVIDYDWPLVERLLPAPLGRPNRVRGE